MPLSPYTDLDLVWLCLSLRASGVRAAPKASGCQLAESVMIPIQHPKFAALATLT